MRKHRFQNTNTKQYTKHKNTVHKWFVFWELESVLCLGFVL